MEVLADPLEAGALEFVVCAGALGSVVVAAAGPVEFPVAMKPAPRVTVERVSVEPDGGEDDGEDGEGDFWVASVLVLVGLGPDDPLVGVGSLLLVVEAMRPLLDGALKDDVEPEEPDDGAADEEDDRLGVPGSVPPPIMLPPLDLIEAADPDLSE